MILLYCVQHYIIVIVRKVQYVEVGSSSTPCLRRTSLFSLTRLPPLQKSDEHSFPSACVCPFESFSCFSRSHSRAALTYKTSSQRTYCASFDRMRVYRQLSAGIAKFCVSVGEIESSLRGNVPGVRGVRLLPVRTKET